MAEYRHPWTYRTNDAEYERIRLQLAISQGKPLTGFNLSESEINLIKKVQSGNCLHCDGTGKTKAPVRDGESVDARYTVSTCEACSGTGNRA
jgi:hypothetical protein